MQRIVSICPSNTELLTALDLTECLVGLDNYSDWPSTVQNLPRVGPDLNIDMEKVKALKPDWVLASVSVPGMEKNIEALEQEGIPYLVLYPDRIQGIPQDFIRVAERAGVAERGHDLAHRFWLKLDEIKSKIPADQHVHRLYWEWWPKPVFTPGRDNWLTDVSEWVGGVNVFGEEKGQSVQTDWAEVARRQPDRVLAVWTGVPMNRVKKEKILSRPPWQGKPFAQPDRIHILEEGWYCRPSQRILTGIEYLAHLLYPDRFDPPDPDRPI
ncbi:cobalamin-binding protein [Desmospora activa]|uniref:Iron complex transport system substrate-binding protein n=1 Tax=Desmospora activa DSM 45169 TaxID=1121389 RepID=A0A2T4Z780_9BACL|nr:cobalamin-binding protein [Desmospora activa]PTM57741.1 iron complex transport system substrate-binding protein [Desmospora activa DSM 45169]